MRADRLAVSIAKVSIAKAELERNYRTTADHMFY